MRPFGALREEVIVTKVALFVQLKARTGKEEEVAGLLTSAQALLADRLPGSQVGPESGEAQIRMHQ